jgi:hypothetical protein
MTLYKIIAVLIQVFLVLPIFVFGHFTVMWSSAQAIIAIWTWKETPESLTESADREKEDFISSEGAELKSKKEVDPLDRDLGPFWNEMRRSCKLCSHRLQSISNVSKSGKGERKPTFAI